MFPNVALLAAPLPLERRTAYRISLGDFFGLCVQRFTFAYERSCIRHRRPGHGRSSADHCPQTPLAVMLDVMTYYHKQWKRLEDGPDKRFAAELNPRLGVTRPCLIAEKLTGAGEAEQGSLVSDAGYRASPP